MVRSYATEDEATIDIEFHDASKHHTIHINNSDDYTMADIGEQCAVLATRDNGHKRRSACVPTLFLPHSRSFYINNTVEF